MTKNKFSSLILILMLVLWTGCGNDDAAVNLEPMFTEPTSFTVSESISDTDVIGTLMAEDESEDLTFSILSNDNDLFEVGETSGELSLASGKSLNFEEDDKHEIAVSVSDGSLSGSIAVTIFVTDDDSNNVMASFDGTDQEAFEEEGSATVTINFDRPVLVEGATVNVTIDPGDMVYSEDYTTTPDGTTGTIEVPVPLGASSVSFALDITNDVLEEGDETIEFTIAAGADNIVIPAPSATPLAFTIIDDDLGEVYLIMGKLGSGATGLTVQSLNPTSGKVNDVTEVTVPGTEVTTPRWTHYANGKLYANLQVFTDPSTATEDLYSLDLATGTFTLVIQDLRAAITSFIGAGDENMNFREAYSDGTTMYITGDVFNTTTFATNLYVFSFDLASETITAGTLLTNSTGVSAFSLDALGEMDGSVVGFNIIDFEEPNVFNVNLTTGEFTLGVATTMSAELLAETGRAFEADGDNFDFKHFSGGASLLSDVDNVNTVVAVLDPTTNEFGYLATLDDWIGTTKLSITLTEVPATILP